MPGARCTRGLVRKMVSRNAHEHTGSAEAIRHSLRNGLRLIRALLGVPGFLAAVVCRMTGRLDPSVGRSGPHDFAVRQDAFVGAQAR